MTFRSAIQMACFARCYKCGRTSIEDGAFATRKDTTATMVEAAGWVLAPGLACCPRCKQERDAP